MKGVWKGIVAASGIALVAVLLFAPLSSSERTVMAPDPSSFANAMTFADGQLSYVPTVQAGRSSLAYRWFGVGPPPSYESSYGCDTPQYVCSYSITSSYPDVFIAPRDSQPVPQVDISQVHLTLNQSEFASVIVTFVLRNDGVEAAMPSVTLNGTLTSVTYAPQADPGQSVPYSFTVYTPGAPNIGDHYFLKMGIMSTGAEAFWFGYAQVES